MQYKNYIVEDNLKSIDKKLFLFFGENLGYKIDIQKKLRLTYKGYEFLKFSQDEILKNESIIFNEVNNVSLFTSKKIFVIDQVNDKLSSIVEDISKKIDTNILFLFAEILDKKSKIRNYFEKSKECAAIACYSDNQITIKKIIMERLKEYDGLNTNIINSLIENCGLDRIKLNNELNKISLYFKDKKIDQNQLEILLNTNYNDDLNLLKDTILIGDKLKTNKLLSETVIDNEKNFFIMNLINQRLRKLLEIKRLTINNNIINALEKIKPPIFWKDKENFLKQNKIWDEKKIRNVLAKTYDLEVSIKSNSIINATTYTKKVIIDICNTASS